MKLTGIEKTTGTRWSSLFLTLLVLSAGACGGDSVTGVDTEVDDLLGSWSIVSLMYTPIGGGSAVEGLTGTASITFVELDLRYTLTIVEAEGTDVEEGTFWLSGSELALTPFGGTDENWFTVTSISSTASTLVPEDAEFDFNDDGMETEATLIISMQKQ